VSVEVKPSADDFSDLPSTNALAVLALLATAPMTAYGIAEQIERALGFYWSVSRRLLLGEPKRLAARGLAEELPPEPRSRAKRRWTATDEGRAVLQRWLRRDVAPTEIASELGLRVIFADQSDLATLRRQLLVRRGQLVAQIRDGLEFADDYIEGGGPFRQRLPIIAATLAMLWEQVLGEIRAVDTMLLISESWTSTTAAPARRDVERMRETREQMAAELARLETLERIDP
jgi:DNA-binding PadR family transcriptional regulator